MSRGRDKRHGQVRMGQLLTTYGPGALLDLPRYSVMVAGLDHWQEGEVIQETRLSERIARMTERQYVVLRRPPVDDGDLSKQVPKVAVWEFPEWFITQDRQDNREDYRSRRLVNIKQLEGHQFIDGRRKSHVVPVRFVKACPRGHIADIDWRRFVHPAGDTCSKPLRLEERGTSGDIAEIYVKCDCGARPRSLRDATRIEDNVLGFCEGDRPWLGKYAREKCGGEDGKPEISRLLNRTASNSYFSQVVSAISIPDRANELSNAVERLWSDFVDPFVDTIEDLEKIKRSRKVRDVLAPFSNDEVWSEISRRKGDQRTESDSLRDAEMRALLAADYEAGDERPHGDFHARRMRLGSSGPLLELVDRVVLIHRLREVRALIGFTRFESASTDVDGELEIGVQRAAISLDKDWFPAMENRGEGIFLGFSRDAMSRWMKRSEVWDRVQSLVEGFNEWKRDHSAEGEFVGAQYVMLHSLSHLLITSVSLESGYSATSIRERIYAAEGGFGILLYTASSDADGTLGGLVQVGRRIEHHLRSAVNRGLLCSNDPVCAQHSPADTYEERFLHGAACHGCLLIAEPSCERWNQYLDRTLVVPTVENLGAEFFPGDAI